MVYLFLLVTGFHSIQTGTKMVTLTDIQKRIAQKKTTLFSRYRIRRLGVFGSCARGDNREGSDVDILVEFERPAGIEFIDLAEELERCIGARVDLVSAGGIKPTYFKVIEKDLVYV
jgi:uncharacterized protein